MVHKSPLPQFSSQFHSFWFSSLFSNLGDGLSLLFFPLLVTQITTDPFLVGVLLSIHRAPWFLCSLVCGSIVDWSNKYSIQYVAHTSRCVLFLLLAILLVFQALTVPLLCCVVFCVGIAEVFADTAASTSLPSLVPDILLERANARLSVTQTVTNEFAGPLIAGIAFAISPMFGAIILASSYLCARLYISRVEACRSSFVLPRAWKSILLQDIKTGVDWFFARPIMPILAIKGGIENFCWAFTSAAFILLASEQYHLSSGVIGLLYGLGAISGIIGGVCVTKIRQRLSIRAIALLNLILQGVGYLLVVTVQHVIGLALMLLIVSFAGIVGNIVEISFRQAITPNIFLGRVTSIFRFSGFGSMMIGALLGGTVATSLGLLSTFTISGATLMLSFIVFSRVIKLRMVTIDHE